MIMVHRKLCLAYYHAKDIKAIEVRKDCADVYNTKLIIRVANSTQVVWVKESPTYILRRMGEETNNSN